MASTSSYSREKAVCIAKVAGEAGRYDDMAYEMVSVVKTRVDLTAEERNLLSVAFKKLIESRRASLKKLREKTDIFTDILCMDRMTRFQENVKREIKDICRDFVLLISDILIPCCKPEDHTATVFYLKLKGDCCRYAAEVGVPGWRNYAQGSLKAYEAARTIARAKLPSNDPIRLGLALNYSIYYYRIQGLTKRAVEIANEAYNEAIFWIHSSKNEETYKDSTQIMDLLSDNIAYWEREHTADVAYLKMGGIASI